MIGHISGSVLHQDAQGTVVSAGGVGYLIHVSSVLSVGDQASLWVTTVVREDAITLYGFGTLDDQATFGALRSVTGIGPAIALALVRDLGAVRVADAVTRKDIKALSSVRGVGAKAAERIISMVKLPSITETTEVSDQGGVLRNAADVLVSLGFEANEARTAILRIHETGRVRLDPDPDNKHTDPVAELVTLALGGN